MTPTPKKPKGDSGASSPFPFPTAEKHDALPATTVQPQTEVPSEDALDHGIEESFPASDPVSVSVTKAVQSPKNAEPGGSQKKDRSS